MGGNETEIVAVLTAAIAANEADVTMYHRLGDIYRKQGQYAKAAAMYDKASQLDPKNSALLSSLAECQLKSGNGAAAAMTYEQAIAMNPAATPRIQGARRPLSAAEEDRCSGPVV